MMNENLGSYRILHLLGQGGMGAVYAAQHTLIAYLNGEGTAKDEKRGLALLRQACDQSDASSCYEIAVLHARGQHVPLDAGRAAELFDKACVLQMGEACRLLADRYASGKGVPRDGERATELRQKACTYGDTASCGKRGGRY